MIVLGNVRKSLKTIGSLTARPVVEITVILSVALSVPTSVVFVAVADVLIVTVSSSRTVVT
jgi:hypothetical protein